MLDIVSKALGAIDKAKEAVDFLKESEHKMQLADLIRCLAESKFTIISLQEKIASLEGKLKIKNKVKVGGSILFSRKKRKKRRPLLSEMLRF